MAISIGYLKDVNILRIHTKHDRVEELEKIEDFYFDLLSILFSGESMVFITKQPQKYSYGVGMENSYYLKVNKDTLLINEIDNCNKEFLKSIISAEEFRRGLLILVKNNNTILSEIDLEGIMEKLNKEKDSSISNFPFIYSDDDGETICLHSIAVSSIDLEHLANKYISN